jgi:predicted ATPase
LTNPKADRLAPEELLKIEAVQLFVERARVVRPEFTLTSQNAAAVAQICRRLDGIPLAIELATARVASLAVEQIAIRLDQRFRLLTIGSRTALPRQQTLRATVAWSYDLLTEQERILFRRLAVFVGGFTLEAAEAVGAGDDVEATEVMALLERLVAKSLVLVRDRGGAARYRLLETIREFSLERLAESGESGIVDRRHAAFYLTMAELPQWRRPRRLPPLSLL